MSADNVVEVAVKATIAELTQGMNQAKAEVDSATSGMSQSFQRLSASTVQYQTTASAVKNTLSAMAKGELPVMSSTLKTLSEQQLAAAMSARELAAAEELVKQEMNGVGAAVEQTIPQYAAASAAVRTLDGNLSIRAAERFLTTTLGIGKALQVAFPVFGAMALLQVLDIMGEKVFGILQEFMGLTLQMRELEKESLQLNRAILTSFQSADIGKRWLAQTNEQIEALTAQKMSLELTRDAITDNTYAVVGSIAAAYQLRDVNDQLSKLEHLRLDQLKQLQTVNKEAARDKEKDDKDALREAKKTQEEERLEFNKSLQVIRDVMDAEKEAARISREAMIKADDALMAEEKAHAEELEKNWRDKQARDKKSLDDSIQDGIAEINGQRNTAKEKIAILQDQLAQGHRLHLVSDKEAVEAEKALVRALYDIDKAALDAKIILLQKDPEKNHKEIIKANGELVTLEEKLQRDLSKATDKGVTERMAKWHQAFGQMESSFASSVKGMVNSTETLGQAVQNMASSIVDMFIDMLAKMLFTWIEKHVMMMVFGKTTNASEIAGNAALAASAAYASVAAIPLVGWAMAPAVGAAAYSEVMAMQGLNAFAQGGVVEGDQVARLHDREMVLPAHIADKVQSMDGSGGGGDVHLHYSPSVSAIDARGMDAVFMAHSKSIVKVIRREMKGGRLK